MAKSPTLGRVKRRLGRKIGAVAALRFYRSCLAHTLLRLARDPRWRCLLAITPDRDVAARLSSAMAKSARLPQGDGDLGRRMQRIFGRLPPGPVIIVSSDIPAIRPPISPTHSDAWATRMPCSGQRPTAATGWSGSSACRSLAPFAGVRWSSAHALADTLANLDGRRVAFAATLSDVDTGEDFRPMAGAAARLVFCDSLPCQPWVLIQT